MCIRVHARGFHLKQTHSVGNFCLYFLGKFVTVVHSELAHKTCKSHCLYVVKFTRLVWQICAGLGLELQGFLNNLPGASSLKKHSIN